MALNGTQEALVLFLTVEVRFRRKNPSPDIDDNAKYRKRWQKMGGIWIAYTNTVSTILQLKAIGL